MTQFEVIERRSDAENEEPKSARLWHIELKAAAERDKKWRHRGFKVIERFRDERGFAGRSDRRKTFKTNMLWANTEIMKSALTPTDILPDVRRRHVKQDALARTSAEFTERFLGTSLDSYNVIGEVAGAVEDAALPGRGVMRVAYDPEIDDHDNIIRQEVRCEYVPWAQFLMSAGRRWTDVWWIAFEHEFNRDELVEFFGEKLGNEIPLDRVDKDIDKVIKTQDDTSQDTFKRASIFEVWDKTENNRIWVSLGHRLILREDGDPYGLADFYPVAEPVQPVTTNDTMIPIPLFTLYQDQAEELDRITTRITVLVEMLKYRGVYDAAADDDDTLSGLMSADDGIFLPYKGFMTLLEKGGLQNAFQEMDVTKISEVLVNLYNQRTQIIETIFQITGISDLVRGFSGQTGTATEKQLQAQFANLRFQSPQSRINRMVRDVLRLKAELMIEHFEPERLRQMAGMNLPTEFDVQRARAVGQQIDGPTLEQVIGVLRQDRLRSYIIDIETSATRAAQAADEQERRLQFVATITQLLAQALPTAAQLPQVLPLIREIVLFAAASFKVGRALEDSLSQAFEALAQPQPQQPDPALIKEQREAQNDQVDRQIRGAELQLKATEISNQDQQAARDSLVQLLQVGARGGENAQR